MSSIKPIKSKAFSELENKLELWAGTEDDINVPGAIPTQFFKLCEIETVDSNLIQQTCKEWPCTVNADGWATNVAASKLIYERLAVLSPCTRYVNGQLKNHECERDFWIFTTICTALRHFQLSRKSLALLNETLDILGMKSVHLMTFCATKMYYLLMTYKQVVDFPAPIYDVFCRYKKSVIVWFHRKDWRSCTCMHPHFTVKIKYEAKVQYN